MDAFDRPLLTLEMTARNGVLTVAGLARQPGWTKPTASRCLARLCRLGWLEKVNDKGFPRYVLGRKALTLAPELRL